MTTNTTPSLTTPFGDSATQVSEAERQRVADGLRIGRIGFLNVYPMHWALGVEPALVGTPAELNAAILADEIDVACISSIAYAQHADELVLLPSMCIAADGAVGSIFVISAVELERVRTLHVSAASATSVVLAQLLANLRGGAPEIVTLAGDPADVLAADEHAGVLLIGDEALRSRTTGSLGRYTFTDLGERWLAETGLPMVYAVWAMRADRAEAEPELPGILDRMLVESVRRFSVDASAVAAAAAEFGMEVAAARTYFDRLCYGFGQRERKGLVRYMRMAHELELLDKVPVPRFASGSEAPDLHDPTPTLDHVAHREGLAEIAASGGTAGDLEQARERIVETYHATVGTRTALTTRPEDADDVERKLQLESDARSHDVDAVLHKALNGERLDDIDGIALLQSSRLMEIGQVAHELRLRKAPEDVITFVVDRNINYTNLCVTDCGFCAFYRRPGDTLEGYLHSTDMILEKIRETIELGGTAALMQGGHNPDLDIEWYIDLFRAVKEQYPTFHLHALSPPEIQHIARRSKMSTAEVLAELRDAGLDSLPGGGGEVLVDRVRRIIAPKKTRTDDWLGIMREAQRAGMSTTASMMYGHVELLSERVEHMRRIRDLQDEFNGFRAFISWTFQPGGTPLGSILTSGLSPYAEHLPPTPTPVDYLRTQAVSRIFLDNFDNIQSSWVTQGMKVGQAALFYGANDLGSIMIEENVVSSAGTTFRASVDDFVHAITATGMRAVQRDTLYRTVSEHAL